MLLQIQKKQYKHIPDYGKNLSHIEDNKSMLLIIINQMWKKLYRYRAVNNKNFLLVEILFIWPTTINIRIFPGSNCRVCIVKRILNIKQKLLNNNRPKIISNIEEQMNHLFLHKRIGSRQHNMQRIHAELKRTHASPVSYFLLFPSHSQWAFSMNHTSIYFFKFGL
jgi:hypothetical protein